MSQNGYGAAGLNGSNGPNGHHDTADEEQPLLNGAGRRGHRSKSLASRMRKAARAEIRRDWADVVLIFCYIITGLLDSSSISIWGSFVSMQTGKATQA